MIYIDQKDNTLPPQTILIKNGYSIFFYLLLLDEYSFSILLSYLWIN